jgi:flagellar biosynthesis protein FlhG
MQFVKEVVAVITRKFTIKQVVEMTGLEESEVRFLENAFKEFLTFTKMDLDERNFTEDHLDLLLRIKELIYKRGFSIEEVKRELKKSIKKFNQDDNFSHSKSASEQGLSKPPGYGRVISVTSGKGGVGKSTVVTNLAVTFAARGKKVAIFDADLGLANVHILMGVKPRFNLSHLIQDGFALEDIIVEGPLGIKIISGGQGVRELANLNDEQRRILLRQIDNLEKTVDILLVDTGAGISENVLRFATFADEIIVVATPNIASNADAFSIIKIMLEIEPNSKIGLVSNDVENMYEAKNIFNKINFVTQKHLNYSLGDLGYIVKDEKLIAANQIRKPLMLSYPQSPSALCIKRIAETILSEKIFKNQKKQSSFSDLIGAIKRTMVRSATII